MHETKLELKISAFFSFLRQVVIFAAVTHLGGSIWDSCVEVSTRHPEGSIEEINVLALGVLLNVILFLVWLFQTVLVPQRKAQGEEADRRGKEWGEEIEARIRRNESSLDEPT